MTNPVAYTVNSSEVAASGMERLRYQTEWMITVPVYRGIGAMEIRDAMRADIQSYMQPDWFDYDKANAMIDEFCRELDVSRFDHLDEPSDDDDSEYCNLCVYVQAEQIVPVISF